MRLTRNRARQITIGERIGVAADLTSSLCQAVPVATSRIAA